jgi:GxxExxY protein
VSHGRHGKHGRLRFEDETYLIQGAVFEVYRAMGAGFLEAVYQECLGFELAARGVPFVAQTPIPISYKGIGLRQTYQADFICFDAIILELKAVRAIAPEHRAQLINYLKATGLPVGLVINFQATPKVEVERFVL